MEWITSAIDVFLHVDKHLNEIVGQYGLWTYAILFLVVFCETGLVVTPFLPGDSLLFAAGALSASGSMSPHVLFGLLFAAAVIGDSVNFELGKYIGTRIFKEDARILKLSYLRRTEEFYAKYGGKTIVMARFVPIVRTYAPFVAGAADMHYTRFLFFNAFGALIWVGGFVYGGYFFGNLPFVQKNFSIVVLMIIVLSVMPIVVEMAMGWRRKRAARALQASGGGDAG